ncbi:MAG: hypothetical protein AAGC81_03390 [Pseudomonadota bacterium]
MKVLTLLAFSLLLMAAPELSRAHPEDEGGLIVLIYPINDGEDAREEEMSVGLHIINGHPNVATLRGLSLSGHGPLNIQRLKDFILFKTWQPVPFLRLEPGDERALLPPRYRIKLPASMWESERHQVSADFGPLGTVEAYKILNYAGSDDAVSQ